MSRRTDKAEGKYTLTSPYTNGYLLIREDSPLVKIIQKSGKSSGKLKLTLSFKECGSIPELNNDDIEIIE